MSNLITFDEAKHEYRRVDSGLLVPSVTGIIKNAGIINTDWIDDYYLERGKWVHLACEYYDLGCLDHNTVDDAISGFVQSYINFRQASPNVLIYPDGIEKIVYNPTWNYVGTVDRICMVNGLDAIIDLKSGSPARWHGLQLSGYSLALGGGYRRYGLYLHKDGKKGTLIEYDDQSDDDVFLGITNFNHWSKKR